jgi:hypothetical protein
MLSRPLALHNPNCRGICVAGDCIEDVEAFAAAVLERFNRGERVGHQPGSHAFQSAADKEDALAFLIEACWQAWLDFDPNDDGRHANKLGGYAIWILHRRHTDWLRKRYGSTRYGPVPVFTPTADPEVHITQAHLDSQYEGGYEDVLDLEASPDVREALGLIRPLIDDETVTIAQAAEQAHVKLHQVTRALTLVRAAARQQGLGVDDEERHTLADEAADLRRDRMTYQQIADALNLGSSHSARALLLDYHPELIKVRAKRPRKAKEPRFCAAR